MNMNPLRANVDHPIKHKGEDKGRFELHRLTQEEREKLGVAAYYRPYRVDYKAVLKGRRYYWKFKRAFDVVCALLALVVLSPAMLLTMLAIFIEDPHSSPIFKQERIGRGGSIFIFYKLRSMYSGAERRLEELIDQNEFDGKAFKIKDDPRITKVGRFIRNTSIDELAQLVNILKGDMSIVGPRPPLPREVEQYDEYERQRFIVTPGLTCFWQVYPKRHEISFDDWVALDIKYTVERNLWVDIKLIMRTVMLVLGAHAD